MGKIRGVILPAHCRSFLRIKIRRCFVKPFPVTNRSLFTAASGITAWWRVIRYGWKPYVREMRPPRFVRVSMWWRCVIRMFYLCMQRRFMKITRRNRLKGWIWMEMYVWWLLKMLCWLFISGLMPMRTRLSEKFSLRRLLPIKVSWVPLWTRMHGSLPVKVYVNSTWFVGTNSVTKSMSSKRLIRNV